MNEGQSNDRVLEALQDWQKKEKNLVSVFGERVLQQREFMKEKLRLYKEAYYGHKPSSSKDEKLTLAILGGEINKLEKKVYPNLIQRLFVQLNDFVVNLLRPTARDPELTLHTFNPQKKEVPASKLKADNGERQAQKNEQKNRVAEPETIYSSEYQKTKMGNAHELSEEAANAVRSALSKNENWLAYSDDRYFLGKGDLYFFKNRDEANEFAGNNISDRESFNVLHFKSLEDVYQKIPESGRLRIDPDANPLLDHDGNAFTDALIGHIEEKQNSHNLKQNDMQEQNFEYLKKQIKFTGFGEGMDRELREKMSKQTPDFTLMHKAQFGNEQNSDGIVLKYFNYSTIFHSVRMMPLLSAVNVAGDPGGRENKDKRVDNWLRDSRLDFDIQLNDAYYKSSGFDKGHMSRREDANWGDTAEDAKRNANLTCMYTNACPQVPKINRPDSGPGLWGRLEQVVLEKGVEKEPSKTSKATVFNGPVFQDSDPVYKAIQVPMDFFKIVVWVTDDGALKATAFRLSQSELVSDIDFEEIDIDQNTQFKEYQVSIQQLAKDTNIDFSGIVALDTFEGEAAERKEVTEESVKAHAAKHNKA